MILLGFIRTRTKLCLRKSQTQDLEFEGFAWIAVCGKSTIKNAFSHSAFCQRPIRVIRQFQITDEFKQGILTVLWTIYFVKHGGKLLALVYHLKQSCDCSKFAFLASAKENKQSCQTFLVIWTIIMLRFFSLCKEKLRYWLQIKIRRLAQICNHYIYLSVKASAAGDVFLYKTYIVCCRRIYTFSRYREPSGLCVTN